MPTATEPTARAFLARLEKEATEEQRVAYRRFFPGDESFIGVRMGTVFAIAKEFLAMPPAEIEALLESPVHEDRKSTRLNSSHANISYAVFCLKKKKLISKNIS